MITSQRLSLLVGLLSFLYVWFWREPSTPAWNPQTPLPFPETHYAQAAGCVQQTYCPASNIVGLEVGDAQLIWTVGDSDAQQRVNIYRSASLGLVVAYAGTNVTSKTSMAINNDYLLDKADPLLGLPAGVKVEGGAQRAWKLHWDEVLEAVQREEPHDPAGRITVTGHSMGAQLAIIASVALEKLYKERVYVLTFGQPRVGNRAFANYIDSTFHPNAAFTSSNSSGSSTLPPHLSYVANGHDYTASLPPKILGYRHFSGQVFIFPANSSTYRVLQGQENRDGTASIWWAGYSMDDHQGAFMGTTLGDIHACPARVGDRF
ncbi:alpha/beta-hydrolase [Microstroma glucosiphilum]|uniref:Alpha/beta-hydrolase n=1 Tax=Pseudomicrostroma glucosiphilum TaxID=1684307 RepID=A0A316U2Z1_9BASI|nr:alpha/beta-hydrolase [Pseudomicrostroma glucosiphilum]PWN18851.1 alpha/beta-hydrolase [Pseudomicrostroma glucosiphilum]